MKSTLRALALSFLVCAAAAAQNAALLPVVRPQFLDNNGAPLVGGYLYTCTAGTTCLPAFVGDPPVNPLATFTDSTGSVANANPIVLDSAGRAGVWLGSGNYKLVLQDANGVTIWSQDNVSSLALKSVTTSSGAVSNFNVPGTLTVGGAATVTGAVTAQSVNAVLNAAQYTGADLGAKITAALAACPSTGCTIQVPSGSSGNVSAPINVTKANVLIACDGNMSVKFTQTFHGTGPTTGSMFYVTGNGFAMTGCYLDAAQANDPFLATNTDNGLVYMVGSNFSHLSHNYFHDGGTNTVSGTQNGIRVVGGASCVTASITCVNGYVTGSYNEVDHNIFDTLPWMVMGGGFNAGYNDFHDNYVYSSGEPFDFNGNNIDSPNMRFHHNTVYNQGTQGFLESVTGAQIDNNYFYLNKNINGIIWVHTAVTTIQAKSRITGNVLVGTSAVLTPPIWVFANSQDTEISNNQIYGFGGDGISVSGQGGTVQRTTLRGNEIFTAGGSGKCAIRLANGGGSNPVVDAWITGNMLLTATGGYGLCSDSTAPTHAVITGNSGTINLPSGCTACTIANNEEVAGTANTQTTATFATLSTSANLQGLHIGGTGSTPSAAAGANAGTSPTITISGTDTDGAVNLTTGSSIPASAGTIFTVTFATPYTSSVICQVTQAGTFNATGFAFVNSSLTAFTLKTNGVSTLTASVPYIWNYHCGGK